MATLIQFYTTYAFELLTVLWIFAIARNILFWLHFIQLKQYRIDRLLAEMKQPKFWRLFFSSYRSILIGFFFAWQLLLRTSVSTEFGAFDALLTTIVLFFLFQFIRTAKHLKAHTLDIPTFTPKVWVLFIILLAGEILLASQYQFWPEQLLLIEIIQPFVVMGLFSLVYIPNFILQKQLMRKARQKREMHRDLTVIGITGSYGKTSMKELLAHILSTKFSVLKTPKHLNVDTGIAKLVLDELSPDHEIFIVEMGAYRVGEIGRIADIVLPNYGVMTGLTNQHLELFGSIEAIAKTKFELVQSVNNPNNVIANAESADLMNEFAKREIDPITYAFNSDARYSATDLQQGADETIFTISDTKISFPLFGKAHAINVLGAIAVAKQLGMNLKEISEALKSFPQIDRTMEVKKGKSDAIIIDDSYNANVESTLLSFEDIHATDRQKILIFKEIIELADMTEEEHKRVIQRAGEVFDAILLLPSTMRKLMRITLLEAGFPEEMILHPEDSERLSTMISERSSIILCEGRESEKFIPSLSDDA